MPTHKLHAVFVIALGLASPLAQAALSPISVAIVPGIQFPSEEYSITGARVSLLFGEHRDLYGVDLGVLGNITDNTFTGIGISGLFNVTRGTTTVVGLQLAAAGNFNTNKTRVVGLQATAGVNWNSASSSIVGIEIAPIANISPFTDIYGTQIGIYNKAQDVYGFQIGVVNVAKSLHGIQVGLLNFNETGLFFVSPGINIGF